MACPICDKKPINCDCTEAERRQNAEIQELEEQVASLRLTNAEREAIEYCANSVLPTGLYGDQETADTLRALLDRTEVRY